MGPYHHSHTRNLTMAMATPSSVLVYARARAPPAGLLGPLITLDPYLLAEKLPEFHHVALYTATSCADADGATCEDGAQEGALRKEQWCVHRLGAPGIVMRASVRKVK